MKAYKFTLVISEGNDEFWEGLKGTGCDEVHAWIKDLLEAGGGISCDGEYQNCALTLTEFKNE